MILLANSEGFGQTLRMHCLICAFAVRICPKTRSAWHSPFLLLLHQKYKVNQDSQ